MRAAAREPASHFPRQWSRPRAFDGASLHRFDVHHQPYRCAFADQPPMDQMSRAGVQRIGNRSRDARHQIRNAGELSGQGHWQNPRGPGFGAAATLVVDRQNRQPHNPTLLGSKFWFNLLFAPRTQQRQPRHSQGRRQRSHDATGLSFSREHAAPASSVLQTPAAS